MCTPNDTVVIVHNNTISNTKPYLLKLYKYFKKLKIKRVS